MFSENIVNFFFLSFVRIFTPSPIKTLYSNTIILGSNWTVFQNHLHFTDMNISTFFYKTMFLLHSTNLKIPALLFKTTERRTVFLLVCFFYFLSAHLTMIFFQPFHFSFFSPVREVSSSQTLLLDQHFWLISMVLKIQQKTDLILVTAYLLQ